MSDFYRWDPDCDDICERSDLVASMMQLITTTRVVVVRATPQVGKTILLRLLGHHILHNHASLEPVFIEWQSKTRRRIEDWQEYLQAEGLKWKEINSRYRPTRAGSRFIFLIDEAQDSYDEQELWTSLKNHNTRSKSSFVLVCVYGATGVLSFSNANIESRALNIDSMQRIELRPSISCRTHMLFSLEETKVVVGKWALSNRFELEKGTEEYLQAATEGHPGMVGLVLKYLEFHFPQVLTARPDCKRSTDLDVTKLERAQRQLKSWSPQLCHEVLTEHEGLLDELTRWGRGVWTAKAEFFVRQRLAVSRYHNTDYAGIVDALRQVAAEPNGIIRSTIEFDSFAFCHRMGYLHTESVGTTKDCVKYTYASPIHRRVAFRRLIPGQDPTSPSKVEDLQEVCLRAIQRISPSALQCRRSEARTWGIPEATIQDELYCCLNHELRNLPILSEYAHTKAGRIDFYILSKRWGIEVLQCGSRARILEHATRFQEGGKYQSWGILDDFVILNFCSKDKVSTCYIEDAFIRSRFLQVVVSTLDCTADVYSHSGELMATYTLGEGRQSMGSSAGIISADERERRIAEHFGISSTQLVRLPQTAIDALWLEVTD